MDPEQINEEEDYDLNYRFYVPNGEDNSNDDYSENDGIDSNGSENSDMFVSNANKRKDRQRVYYRDIKVAKKDDEIKSDILDMFASDNKKRSRWTWDDIKKYHEDQPEANLKRIVEDMCDKVDGIRKGGLVEYELKSNWK